MTVTVVTGFSPKGLEEYGFNFIKGFCEYWPVEVDLVMYLEKPIYDVRLSPIDRFIGGRRRYVEIRLIDEVVGCSDFIERHKDNPAANGTDVQPNWKERDREEGYNFRWDAVKFCRMAMFSGDAASRLVGKDRILVWLDGDVMTRRPIPSRFIENLVGDHEVTYLGRDPKWPDTAFLAFQGEYGRWAAQDWAEEYRADTVFKMRETHSAFVLHEIIKHRRTDLTSLLNLTPKGRGHVWFQSPLGQYMDHLKGQKRKRRGRSKEFK